MRLVLNHLLLAGLAAGIMLPLPAIAQDENGIEISGFARVLAGYLDTDRAYFEGYEDEISLTEKSLLGLQADYSFSKTTSISGQLLLHSDSNRRSGLEWLYLKYEPYSDWQFKIGRMRTPYLKYSDVFDVGYAYPWVSPPPQLYNSYLFLPQYEGVNASYRYNFKSAYIDFEGYYGDYSDGIDVNGTAFKIDVTGFYGGVVALNYSGWQFRAAALFTDDYEARPEGADILIDGLRSVGYNSMADALEVKGRVESGFVGLTYDSLQWFMAAEYLHVSTDIPVIKRVDNFYTAIGRYFEDYQLVITYAQAVQQLANIENTVPLGSNPLLSQLHLGVDRVIASLPTDELTSVTFTGRWDFRPSMALKAEVMFLNGKPGKTSQFELKPGSEDFDRKAVLYQFGIEWVF